MILDQLYNYQRQYERIIVQIVVDIQSSLLLRYSNNDIFNEFD